MSDGRPAANDEERLPWLEPYREPSARRARPAKPAKPKKQSGRGGLVALAGIVGLSAALAGGYWLGQRETSPTVPIASPASPALPQAAPQKVADAAPAVEVPVVEVAETAKVAADRPKAKATRQKSARRSGARRAKIRSAGVESANIDKVRKQQGEPVTQRVWPRQPSPGPAGRVIQLGAFSNPDRAYVTYRARIARYPALGRMPRVIVPVAKGRNGRLLYVLRLGTASRQQSKRVCRNLKRSGDHCLVIG